MADRLHSAAIHLLRGLRKADLAAGIGPARLSALSVLVFAGPRTLGELAAAEQVAPPTMSRIVRGLEKDGLAARQADAKDGRVWRVRATAAGRRTLQAARRRRIARLAARLDPLSGAEVRRLEGALDLLERIAASERSGRKVHRGTEASDTSRGQGARSRRSLALRRRKRNAAHGS